MKWTIIADLYYIHRYIYTTDEHEGVHLHGFLARIRSIHATRTQSGESWIRSNHVSSQGILLCDWLQGGVDYQSLSGALRTLRR